MRTVLEIACTRLARPEADLTIEALAERVARLEAMVANGAVPASVAAAQAAAPAASVPAAAQQPTLISGARAAAPAASAACCYVRARWHALGPRSCRSGGSACTRVSFQACSACTSACAGSDVSARCGPRACHRSGI